ncbi:4-coumarate--CoA ligase (photoactive yellow protein activation family) [Idiomarina fontislapidosi]|uniref:AMP-dependent synthetase/ligase domain-containing protein n=1 Tax=Idiomarina fontislapidosi TaxID=263723 RepID=A0A432YAW2_9GAMM|nr:AMP-binding protein [Idiomarina fontislapidosi]PYE35199.1 4-coumarate--CoA ligase (photoactive yellow protein activation family) [Idiomarina fontislapidosi]RUO58094.1 hypothetical protein CWE25_00380 [Idiomarina fontislapidosi]
MAKLTTGSIVDILGAIIADELGRLRMGDEQLWKGRQWHPSSHVVFASKASGDPHEVVVDSFEWMSIASRVVEFFQLNSSGLEDYLLRFSTLEQWAEVIETSREDGRLDITFCSSGSTAQVTHHRHHWMALVAEAQFFIDFMHRHDVDIKRVVSFVPPHHIYGFIFSILLPELLQIPVLRGLKALSTTQAQQLQSGDLLIGFPAVFEQCAQLDTAFPRGVHAVCSTGPCAPQVLKALTDNGLSRVFEVYGCTETGGVGIRNSHDEPYQLLPRWIKQGNDELMDNVSRQVIELPDSLKWHAPGLFEPVKRKDDTLSICGKSVHPETIARVIKQHPNISDARVRLIHEQESRALKALLIADPDSRSGQTETLIAQVRTWLADKLEPHELPKRFTVRETVPTNELGKEIDWESQPDLMRR